MVSKSFEGGLASFWDDVTAPQAIAALKLTLGASAIVVAINAVFGTIIAWVLVRDEFPGKRIINSLIDLPFALPTIVAGITLIALYGDNGVLGLSGVAFTRIGVVMALLFVTLPFVIRSVQPVLIELDRDMEEAAASLGAGPLTTFRRIILPNLRPAILSGIALAFARSIGEFGSLVLISGNIPFKTEVASVFIFSQIQSDREVTAAAVSVVLLAIALRDPDRDRDRLPKEPAPCRLTPPRSRPGRSRGRRAEGQARQVRAARDRARLPVRAAADPGDPDLLQGVRGRGRARDRRRSPRPRRSTPSS